MARVLTLTGDLLFGSQLQGSLRAAGHEVELIAGEGPLREAIGSRKPDAVIADLTDPVLEAARIVAGMDLEGIATLGFYSHVEPEARAQGEAAGIALVVPRSRMAREAPALLDGLLF